MAYGGSWPSIQKHGLLSTTGLLDLYEIEGSARDSLELTHRQASVPISHPSYGRAVVRDQKPMSDSRLRSVLRDGTTVEEWYQLLNGFVFFWPTEARLETMRAAYEGQPQTILSVDSRPLLAQYASRVRLSAINSGATRPYARPRGRSTFLPMAEYPFPERRARGKASAVAEVLIERGVPNIHEFVVRVEEVDERGRKRDVRLHR
jgi:hypothetical protein